MRSSPDNLRLLLVLTEFPPSIGGMQTHAFYLARHLVEAGHDIQVVTYHSVGSGSREALRSFDDALGFQVHRSLSRISYWHSIELLKRIAREFQPDLIYCSTVFYGLLRDSVEVPIVCRSVGNDVLRPWIAYPFQLGSRLLGISGLDNWAYGMFRRMNSPEWVEVLLEKKRRALVERSVQWIDIVIANSNFTASLFDDMGVDRDRVRVLVGGVDARRFEPNGNKELSLRRELGIAEDAYVIVTVCRLVAKKGVDFLLRAFPTVQDLVPNAHLLIVGDGKDRKYCRRLAQELELDRVTFAGRVDHLQVQRYYWLSNLFVLASRVQVNPVTNRRDAETMGRVLCEANAAGIPVIASRSGGIPSVITHGQNGLLFDSDDEDDFLNQIRAVWSDPTLTRSLTEAGLKIASRRFDWSVVHQAHESYFKEVVSTL
ncbi:MAG: glycosyltransferase family 4 protein [Anaerolineaceae bacterium]|nr:MAG: glycosyltransferase family 4 protein [Anaerolineaceae bacterium]